MQLFYSNQYTRYDLIQTIHSLLQSSLIKDLCLTPIRLIVEHAALVSILSTNVGIELGANLLQKLCLKISRDLKEKDTLKVENKTLDNQILFLCNLFNFRLFSSNLLIDLLNDYLIENLSINSASEAIEKNVDLILLVLRCVGFSIRKDNPVQLKDLIIKLQSKVNIIKSDDKNNDESMNNRLKFMIESINALKNNDIRRLDAFDQQPIELIKKQMKTVLKEEKDQTLLNITFKDLINANELGRWWIVGSAWNLKENQKDDGEEEKSSITRTSDSILNGEGFSEKILRLAKAQHMNTDVRRSIFCIIVSAEVNILTVQ